MNFKKTSRLLFLFLLTLFGIGCSTIIYQGVTTTGEPVYLDALSVDETPGFQRYGKSSQSEAEKILYVMSRIRGARELSYLHDENWYNSLQAYRGGMWLLRNRYKEGQTASNFLQEQVRLSEGSGDLHLIEYPDGTLQNGYYVLLNELDRLEKATSKL